MITDLFHADLTEADADPDWDHVDDLAELVRELDRELAEEVAVWADGRPHPFTSVEDDEPHGPNGEPY